jgi:hypothetical protein
MVTVYLPMLYRHQKVNEYLIKDFFFFIKRHNIEAQKLILGKENAIIKKIKEKRG